MSENNTESGKTLTINKTNFQGESDWIDETFINSSDALSKIKLELNEVENSQDPHVKNVMKNRAATRLFIVIDEIAKVLRGESKDALLEEFEKGAPEIYADLISAIDNPNCSCRGRVGKFLRENTQKSYDLVANTLFKIPEPDSDFFLNLSLKFNKVVSKIGKAAEEGREIESAEANNPKQLEGLGNSTSLSGSRIMINKNQYEEFLKSIYTSHSHFRGLSVVDLNKEDLIDIYFY